MGISKIKSLVIAALALINIFFLIFIITDRINDRISRNQATANACAVLNENGITIDPADVHPYGALRSQSTSRSLAAEERLAAVFLGQAQRRDQGVYYRFVNDERGTAVFYSGGVFSVSVNEGLIIERGGTQKTVKRLLRDMGVSSAQLYLSGKPGLETVTVVCAYDKISVFNCTIKFEFSGGSLVSVSGRYVPVVEETEMSTEISSPGTALLGFLAWVRGGGGECERIDRVEAGYRLRDTNAFGDGVLSPVWLITADSGRFIMDTQTGEIHLLPSVYD